MGYIHETDLLGKVFFETSPNTGTATWTNHTATVSSMSLSRGGSAVAIGVSNVEVGSGVIQLVDNDATIGIGYWVRVRTTLGNVWAGFVQDTQTRYEFVNGVRYEIRTLFCVDWVGYAGQIIFPYATAIEAGGTAITAMPYAASKRVNAFNYNIDATGETQLVSIAADSGAVVGHSNRAASLAEHLDLLANTVGGRWNSTTATPTNGTTGRDGLIAFSVAEFYPDTGLTFTDNIAAPSGLKYQGITISASSSSIANVVLINNSAQLAITGSDVTYNPDLVYSHQYETEQVASVTAYGARQISVETNLGLRVKSGISANTEQRNRVINPNFESDGVGWSLGENANQRQAIRNPLLEATPFAAKAGVNAVRARARTAQNNFQLNYLADDKDGIAVVAGQKYGFSFWGAKNVNRSGRINGSVFWYDLDNNLLSTSTGAIVDMPVINTWYQARDQYTAPANAVKATLRVNWSRPSGLNWQIGDKLWCDKVTFHRMENAADWYENDGEFLMTSTDINFSLGNVGASESVTVSNPLHSRAVVIADENDEPALLPQTITWNAQQDLTKVHLLDLNKFADINFDGDTTGQVIEGLRHEITRDKWIVEIDFSNKRAFLPI